MKQLFEGIFENNGKLYTKSIAKGQRVYGELLIHDGETEYREWDFHRSKYGAAVKKGLKESIFAKNSKVLYLGSAEGTTVSHVSDIVENEGLVFCIDISTVAMIKLLQLAERRENLMPLVGNAENPGEYAEFIEEKVDAMFQDISQRNQAEIFVKNAKFLKKGGLAAIAIKTKSISQSEKKEDIVLEEKRILESEFEVLQVLSLEPYEKHHYFILMKKK
ncbi:MAG: fibrillarin-like rRNA/tRNA 2'-O-methyltransferase [archaeon]